MMLNWETELIGIFSTDQDVAFAAAEAFLGTKPSTIDEEIVNGGW